MDPLRTCTQDRNPYLLRSVSLTKILVPPRNKLKMIRIINSMMFANLSLVVASVSRIRNEFLLASRKQLSH